MYLCHSEILMPKDTKSLGNNKAPACESRGFVLKKKKVRILTHLLFHFSETAGINHNRTLFLRETVPVIGHIPRFQEFIFTQVQRGQPVIATIQLSRNRISRKIQRSQLVVITPQRFQHRIMRHIQRSKQIFTTRQPI